MLLRWSSAQDPQEPGEVSGRDLGAAGGPLPPASRRHLGPRALLRPQSVSVHACSCNCVHQQFFAGILFRTVASAPIGNHS